MAGTDEVLFSLLADEDRRQAETLTLIASENHTSLAVRRAVASRTTDKYAEGYPAARYYGGCEVVDQIESLAIERALALFPGADHANVQPHSGTTANLEVLTALAGPGGRIVGMALAAGGHLSHGHKVSHTGKFFDAKQYGTNPETGLLDYDEVEALVQEHKPKVLIAGGSAYPREIDYARMAAIAHAADAYFLADIAHPAGLIAAGVMPSPLPHADVVTMTTHKTLRGPRGGMILCRQDLAKSIDRSAFPGAQGGPLVHHIAGKAVAFGEANTDAFRTYQKSVKANAAHLAQTLADASLSIVTGGTDSHVVLVDLREAGMTGAELEDKARAANLVINKNAVPNDPRPPRETSGIRVGTAAATTRGMGTGEMEGIARVLIGLVRGESPESFRGTVGELCEGFPLPD
ncbi:MAG: serine hydroxymethyltransferase [Planctomycetota bacterium]